MSAPAQTLPALAVLKRRANAYGWACAWLVLLGLYLLVSGLINGLPDATSHTAFTSIQVHSSLLGYWQAMHLPQSELDLRQIAGLPGMLFEVGPGVLDMLLCLPIVACLIWRKYLFMVPLLLIGHLSFQAQAVCAHRIAYHAAPVQALTPAVTARLAADASAADAPPALLLKGGGMVPSCDRVIAGKDGAPATIASDCSLPFAQAMLHHILMQRAYLAGDATTARAQYDAIDPNYMLETWGIGWRAAIVREWLIAVGQPPKTHVPANVMAIGDVRRLSRLCLAAGALALSLAVLVLALAVTIRRRTLRLADLIPATGTA